MQKRVEFCVENQKLVGDLHLPDNSVAPFPCLVLSHGYMGNRNGEKHLQIGYRFPLEGMAVLRFDHLGALGGESGGQFEDTTLTGRVRDLTAVLDYLKGIPEVDSTRVGLLGSSLGGTTILALPKSETIRAIVLLSTPVAIPVLRVEARERLGKQGFLQYPDGTRIKKTFFDDLARYDLLAEVRKIRCPLLIIHSDLDNQVPRHQAFVIYRNAAEPKAIRMIEGADHAFSDTEKLNEVLALALDWFLKYLL